jgi:hypothetical protein
MNSVTPTQSNEFSVSYDLTTEILTAVVIVGILVLTAVVHIIFVGVLMILIPILGFAYSPRRYVISGRDLIVKRLIGNADVPLESVREARRITKDDMRGAIRLFGSGGFFGYTLYSPDDVDGFLEAVRSYMS